MPTLRSKCVSTKVTPDQHASFVRAAQGKTVSAWAQDALVAAAAPTRPSIEQILLAEFLALRAIVLNLYFALASGEPLTPDTMQRLIERADHDKLAKARERLTSAPQRGRL